MRTASVELGFDFGPTCSPSHNTHSKFFITVTPLPPHLWCVYVTATSIGRRVSLCPWCLARFLSLLSPLALCDIRPDAPGIQLVRLIELLLQQICCPFATLTEWSPAPVEDTATLRWHNEVNIVTGRVGELEETVSMMALFELQVPFPVTRRIRNGKQSHLFCSAKQKTFLFHKRSSLWKKSRKGAQNVI